MEEQEHKISSYIEQQEEFKSTVGSFVCCRMSNAPKSSLLCEVLRFLTSDPPCYLLGYFNNCGKPVFSFKTHILNDESPKMTRKFCANFV